MKKLLIGLFLIFNFGFTQIVPDTSKMTMTEKMLWYQNEKKSPARAFFYSWLLPTAGHAYAGEWKKGIKFKCAEIVALAGGFTLIETSRDISYLGIGMFLSTPIIIIWEYYDVVKTATKYNKQLYKDLFGEEPKMKISFIPKSNGLGLSLSYNL